MKALITNFKESYKKDRLTTFSLVMSFPFMISVLIIGLKKNLSSSFGFEAMSFMVLWLIFVQVYLLRQDIRNNNSNK